MKYGFVVEGFHDEEKVKRVLPNAYVVVTKGTRFDNRVKMDVEQMFTVCDVSFLLSDPDEAGEQLANKLLDVFPQLHRVMLEEKECICYRNKKRKVGVEHCSDEYLMNVLSLHLPFEEE